MKNPRITNKERGLLKGAIRRVFSRSEIRRKVVALTIVQHHDLNRPRVKKWSVCPLCELFIATYQLQVDHRDPIVPTDTTLEDMSWDTVIDRVWCVENNLMAICKPCHKEKTKLENKERKKNKGVKL